MKSTCKIRINKYILMSMFISILLQISHENYCCDNKVTRQRRFNVSKFYIKTSLRSVQLTRSKIVYEELPCSEEISSALRKVGTKVLKSYCASWNGDIGKWMEYTVSPKNFSSYIFSCFCNGQVRES